MTENMQQCGSCREWKSEDGYSPSYRGKSGTWCRSCFSEYHRKRRAGAGPRPRKALTEVRVCEHCGEQYTPKINKPTRFCGRKCKTAHRNAELRRARQCLTCGEPAEGNAYLCAAHLYCEWPGCSKPKANGRLCPTHKAERRMQRNSSEGLTCDAEGCSGTHYAIAIVDGVERRACRFHHGRFSRSGEWGGARRIALRAARYTDPTSGYVFINHPTTGRRMPEHRVVMELAIGRPLHKFENVHHVNGVRDDNRPSNLELWTKAQPAGQRVEDLVAWVVDIYPEYVRAALNGETQMRLPD